MKGLSLTQPWATLVALGAKTIETRSWPTAYRGPILIQAAKGFPRDCQALCWREPFASALIAGGYDRSEQLPLGVILAVARLDSVVPTEDIENVWRYYGGAPGFEHSAREQAFGDYSPNRYAWILRDVRRLANPLPVKGALGLWPISQVMLDLVAGQGVLD